MIHVEQLTDETKPVFKSASVSTGKIILTLTIGAANMAAIVIRSGNVLRALEFFKHILFNQNNSQGV